LRNIPGKYHLRSLELSYQTWFDSPSHFQGSSQRFLLESFESQFWNEWINSGWQRTLS
jgi:hypothetical protein